MISPETEPRSTARDFLCTFFLLTTADEPPSRADNSHGTPFPCQRVSNHRLRAWSPSMARSTNFSPFFASVVAAFEYVETNEILVRTVYKLIFSPVFGKSLDVFDWFFDGYSTCKITKERCFRIYVIIYSIRVIVSLILRIKKILGGQSPFIPFISSDGKIKISIFQILVRASVQRRQKDRYERVYSNIRVTF